MEKKDKGKDISAKQERRVTSRPSHIPRRSLGPPVEDDRTKLMVRFFLRHLPSKGHIRILAKLGTVCSTANGNRVAEDMSIACETPLATSEGFFFNALIPEDVSRRLSYKLEERVQEGTRKSREESVLSGRLHEVEKFWRELNVSRRIVPSTSQNTGSAQTFRRVSLGDQDVLHPSSLLDVKFLLELESPMTLPQCTQNPTTIRSITRTYYCFKNIRISFVLCQYGFSGLIPTSPQCFLEIEFVNPSAFQGEVDKYRKGNLSSHMIEMVSELLANIRSILDTVNNPCA